MLDPIVLDRLLDPAVVASVAAGAALLSLVLLVVVIVQAVRLRRLTRAHRRAFQGVDEDVLGAITRTADELEMLRASVADARADTHGVRERLRTTVSRVGVLRYDAFDDMGGALSFSAALLDEQGDGMVISAINGRSETRCYAKPVAAGTSEHSLSREETEAVAAALEGRPAASPPAGGRRRRRAS